MPMKVILFLSILSLCASTACAQKQVSVDGPTEKVWEAQVKEATRSLSCVIEFTVDANAKTSKLEIVAAFPKTITKKQKTSKVKYSLRPEKIIKANNQVYLKWVLNNPKGETKIRVAFDAEISKQIFDAKQKNYNRLSTKLRKFYVQAEKWHEVDNQIIQTQAENIEDGKTVVQTAKNIHDYVVAHMKFKGFRPEPQGAVKSYTTGIGDCDGYSDLFVTLARAKNIPARQVTGLLTHSVDTPLHAWSEFYSPKHGWIPVDTLHADLKNAKFGNLQNKYLVLSYLRTDETLNKYQGYALQWWGDRPKVKCEFKITDKAFPKMKPVVMSY